MVETTEPTDTLVRIEHEVDIDAPLAIAWECLLEQIGPASTRPDGTPMPLKLEAWPGGRWFRDLGNNAGHLWGHVQVIKPPVLLELNGPMFMSYPAVNHVQYRLSEDADGTRLKLVHRAFGDIAEPHRKGMTMGWQYIIGQVKKRAER